MEEKNKKSAIEKKSKTTATKAQKQSKPSTKQKKEILQKDKSEQSKKVNGPKNIKILGFNDLELNTYIFEDVKQPKAVVVIVHGMQEHCLRYSEFAKFLNKNGYIVIANDLRGHGKTMRTKDEYGKGEKDIFTETLKDQLNIIEFANQTYNLPVYLFGHSYGSMLSQNLIQLTPLIEKAVICGTTNGSCGTFKMGSFAISLMNPFKKKDKRGGLVEKMCINAYAKDFENGNWLSRDEKVFEKYKQDEFCGGTFPFSFYRSLIKNMTKANSGIGKIGNKKIFLIAGDKDPVGEKGKQVKKLFKLYLKNNIDTKMKLYPDARHELINEINKDEVMQDVLNFYEN